MSMTQLHNHPVMRRGEAKETGHYSATFKYSSIVIDSIGQLTPSVHTVSVLVHLEK